MRVAVVFESMFGNTEQVAEAICEGLRDQGAEVTRCRVADAGDHELAQDLLVLGAPTHTFTLSRPATRAEAVIKGAGAADAATGVREWLEALEPRSASSADAAEAPGAVAVFDTRATKVRHLPGSAARRTARLLRQRGLDVGEVTSFYVEDVRGPLAEGELSRARSWGRHLAVTTR
ncbi:flavodoxin family protein [Nocardioides sp. AX2bis]|uniref:flavodoxin family protein n=1 Tax=Nocardioides sp. AX2bis TaxID=2653157 RepID=UPI0012EF98C8|nr:flavodoxin domain-containing protein [Nocardioides sp. AX2bis]VXC46336.1 Flavodoxin [Nocardioides sp. AX2bis]